MKPKKKHFVVETLSSRGSLTLAIPSFINKTAVRYIKKTHETFKISFFFDSCLKTKTKMTTWGQNRRSNLPWTHIRLQPESRSTQAYAQRQLNPNSRRLFAQKRDDPTDSCMGTCFREAETIRDASACVVGCGLGCHDLGWGCYDNPRQREGFCAEQCKNVIGWSYEPDCDNDGLPGGCFYDRHDRCQDICERACD